MDKQPVVLIYIDGDSYGGDARPFAGNGMPIVIIFDGGRYDKYNRMEGDNPREDYAEDLESLKKMGHDKAYEMLDDWVEDAM